MFCETPFLKIDMRRGFVFLIKWIEKISIEKKKTPFTPQKILEKAGGVKSTDISLTLTPARQGPTPDHDAADASPTGSS
jgi:hypothetical protein